MFHKNATYKNATRGAALALALGACSRSETTTVRPAAPAAPAAPASSAQGEAAKAVTRLAPRPPKPPEPPKMRRAYVGRWAATPQLCAEGAWRFDTLNVATAGEVSCRFGAVRSEGAQGPESYQVDAICFAEGAETRESFTLAMAGRDRMAVRGGPWSRPIELQRCPA